MEHELFLEKLEKVKILLDDSPEVDSYEPIDDGLEICVRIKPFHSLSSPNAVMALKVVDSFAIDFIAHRITLFVFPPDNVSS